MVFHIQYTKARHSYLPGTACQTSLSSRIVRQLRHSSLVRTFRHVYNLFPLGMIPSVQPLHMYFEISKQNTAFFSTHESTQHAAFLSVEENAMNSILFITDSFMRSTLLYLNSTSCTAFLPPKNKTQCTASLYWELSIVNSIPLC